jgi:hypothetical protein
MKVTERLEKYFRENEEWHDYNWTTPRNENPYPNRIYYTFIPHFNGQYKMTATYIDNRGREVTEVVDRDTMEFATMHAWFDCTDLDGCIDLLESWVRDYYEDRYECGVKISIEKRRKK